MGPIQKRRFWIKRLTDPIVWWSAKSPDRWALTAALLFLFNNLKKNPVQQEIGYHRTRVPVVRRYQRAVYRAVSRYSSNRPARPSLCCWAAIKEEHFHSCNEILGSEGWGARGGSIKRRTTSCTWRRRMSGNKEPGIHLGHDTGNPWVTRPLPAPTPVWHPYPRSRVWVYTGMGVGYPWHHITHGYGFIRVWVWVTRDITSHCHIITYHTNAEPVPTPMSTTTAAAAAANANAKVDTHNNSCSCGCQCRRQRQQWAATRNDGNWRG